MYKVNGEFPSYSASLYTLENGDEVEWVYTRDLGKDVGDGYNSGTGGNTGKTTVTPPAKVSSGAAKASVTLDDMKEAIGNAKGSSEAIVVAPKTTETVNSMQVDLSKDAINAIIQQTGSDLILQTPVGNLTIPRDALEAIASQARGGTVTMNVASVDASTLTPAQQEAVGGNMVYDISIMSGSTSISSFNGAEFTISLPYTLREGESAENVRVWYLNDTGELVQINCAYAAKTGLVTFTTDHLSHYVVGYEQAETIPVAASWSNPFSDVRESDWFYEAVQYAVQNGLLVGATDTEFRPGQPMTRAMLVTVLHRLAGEPAAGSVNFDDVSGDAWYAEPLAWALANDIVSGYGNGRFGPNDHVTREQMAAILHSYASCKGCDVTAMADLSLYTDGAAISPWAQNALSWANAEGFITGRTATTLAPGGSATRAEVAAILMRFVEGLAS